MKRFVITFFSLCLFALSIGHADIYVGFGTRDITPPKGTPSAGYQKRHGQGMVGTHDPLLASALALKTDDNFVVFCSVDHLGYLYGMTQAVMEQVHAVPGLEMCEIYLGSTHTHSGGGAYINIPGVGENIAGKFDSKVTQLYIDRAAEAIIASTQKMQRAKVGIGYGNAKWLTCYRATCPEKAEPLGDITVIKVTSLDDQPLACLFNFAAHPTLLTWQNRLFSADFVGDARGAIKNQLGKSMFTLFFNSAQGDINPAHTFEKVKLLPFDKTARMGRALAKQVVHTWNKTPTFPNLSIKAVKLPYTFAVKQHDTAVSIPIENYRSEINLLVFNKRHAFVTIPGELSCVYNHRLKAFAKEKGFANISILGLTNDAHGYIITPEAWSRHTSESFECWGGENYGERVELRVKRLFEIMSSDTKEGHYKIVTEEKEETLEERGAHPG